MLPKPTLHAIAQKFRARARLARIEAKAHEKNKDRFWSSVAMARAVTFDQCAAEIERLKKPDWKETVKQAGPIIV